MTPTALIAIVALSFSMLFQVLPVNGQEEQKTHEWTGKLRDEKILTKDALENILANHKIWLESKEKEGKRANLSKANLSKANLSKANLQKAILWNTNLSKADLEKADLEKANLREAILSNATWAKPS